MSLRFAVDCNVLLTLDIYNILYQKQAWRVIQEKTGQISLRVLRFSLVNIIPAMVSTHLQLHVLFPDGRTGEAREPSKDQYSYGNRSALDRKVTSL
jgi:hypothetical protein